MNVENIGRQRKKTGKDQDEILADWESKKWNPASWRKGLPRYVILARHAEYSSSERACLTKEGHTDAEALATRLEETQRKLNLGSFFVLMYSSLEAPALHTAELLKEKFEGIHVNVCWDSTLTLTPPQDSDVAEVLLLLKNLKGHMVVLVGHETLQDVARAIIIDWPMKKRPAAFTLGMAQAIFIDTIKEEFTLI